MNIDTAKSISLTTLLGELGHHPARQGAGQEFWYRSPFRNERTPSFKVKDDKVFYDHGEGFGGTVVEFAMRYRRTNSVKEVLEWLSHYAHLARKEIQVRPLKKSNERRIQVNSVNPLTSWSLKHYLTEVRKINYGIARHYLKEIEFAVNEKSYVALGFANRSGGWELRNKWFKGTTHSKDISLIKSPFNPNKTLSVFEGFIDFLSLITRSNHNYLASDVVVLNSLALQHRAMEMIETKQYQDIYIYFDNDVAGQKATTQFEQLPFNVSPQNHRYAGFKDINDQLTKQQHGYER